MVVGLALAAVQMGMALPTGFLFGVGYGTGVRIGYEQVYPLLFPKGARPTTTELAATMKGMNTVYDAIGGKDASRMGIAVGITNAGEILNNPDFRVLEQLESSSSGPTSSNSDRSRYGLDQESAQQAVSSEIDRFNYLTGAQKYALYKTYTNQQLLNIRSFSTTDESGIIAGRILAERQLNPTPGPTTTVTTNRLPPEPYKHIDDAKKPEALVWTKKRDDLFNNVNRTKKQYNQTIYSVKRRIEFQEAHNSYILQLSRMSNDYRNPNNFIRTQALLLRRLLQTPALKRLARPQFS